MEAEVGAVMKGEQMESSIKTFKELKEFYQKLNGEYEGYIQMSDKIIEHIFKKPTSLPSWDSLHNNINYILEMALFEPKSNKSILVRQANDKWITVEKFLTKEEIDNTDIFYTIKEKDNLKAKVAQIWQEEEDEFCLGLQTLTPKTLLFAGFKTGGQK